MRYLSSLLCAFFILSADTQASTFEESRKWRCEALKKEVPKQDQLLAMTIDDVVQADTKFEEVKKRQKAGQASYQDVTDASKNRRAILESYTEMADAFDKLLLKTIQICDY